MKKGMPIVKSFVKITVFTISIALIASAKQAPKMPVMVGGDEFDACGSSGKVVGLTKNGFLAVRTGPGESYPMIDKLKNGQDVWLCDDSKDGNWAGIVYGKGKNLAQMDCGVGSPIEKRQPYKGKCKSGWVNHKWVKLIAG